MAGFDEVENLFEYQKQLRDERRMRDYVPDEPKKSKKKFSIAEIAVIILVATLLLLILVYLVVSSNISNQENGQNNTKKVVPISNVTYKNSKSGVIITNRSGAVE